MDSELKPLVDLIYELVKDQHEDRVNALAYSLGADQSKTIPLSCDYFVTQTANGLLVKICDLCNRLNVPYSTLGLMLQASKYAVKKSQSELQAELVWSGPDSQLVPVRRSEQVLIDLINNAERSLHLMSFVWINVSQVEFAIRSAIARGVSVSLLIETESKNNDDGFRTTASRLNREIPEMLVYEWPLSARDQVGYSVSMHAKSFVADRRIAFITSANLTGAALDRNIEAGVLVTGSQIPGQICDQFKAMVNSKVITPLAKEY